MLGAEAFINCSNLETVKMLPVCDDQNGSLIILGDRCFGYCGKLKEVVLPEGLQTIGKECFIECSSIPSLVLPSSTLIIGPRAFSGCTALQTVSTRTPQPHPASFNGAAPALAPASAPIPAKSFVGERAFANLNLL